jgi:nucleolar protein 9
MPQENKHSRGRRDDKKNKRKREETDDVQPETKRARSTEPDHIALEETANHDAPMLDYEAPMGDGPVDRPFYGLLEDEEQEYFRRADELLELNNFGDAEERDLFLANVFKEAEGKELKIANSQGCSRLMERLILLSNTKQKKKLFAVFSGHFLYLIQHRFASHCCETLFVQSAPVVTEELTGEDKADEEADKTATDGDEVYVSMENLFLYTLNELEGQMAFLLTDRFASHTLRVLLVILSGRPLAKSSTRSLLQSKKKEKISITGMDSQPTEFSLGKRAVPESFSFAVDKIISDTAAGMDTSFIRVLATHPTGNPSLQLLLELELTKEGKKAKDENSIIRKLLPDDVSEENSESSSFVNGLMYDSIGSRLLETIVTFAPGKLFKQIYKTTFKERMGALARNETAGYVVTKVLERLSKEDLEEAVQSILPQIPGLIERSRTTVVKTLLERCAARKADVSEIAAAIKTSYGEDNAARLLRMVQLDPSSEPTEKPTNPRESLHGSLLAQTMLSIPGPLTDMIQTSLLAQSNESLLFIARTTTTSHILQAALKPTAENTAFRRKMANKLVPHVGDLALDTAGSHVIDALWTGTEGLMNLKERVAAELIGREAELRDSFVGRVVWRNWMLDLFKRRKGEWVGKVKGGEGGAGRIVGVTKEDVTVKKDGKANGKGNNAGKSGIELARERFAKEKATKEAQGKATGANGNVGL